jgi:hypothetical protein
MEPVNDRFGFLFASTQVNLRKVLLLIIENRIPTRPQTRQSQTNHLIVEERDLRAMCIKFSINIDC